MFWREKGGILRKVPVFPVLCISLVAAVCLTTLVRHQRENAITDRVVAAMSRPYAVPQSPRRSYPYSVIPGGAHNAAELGTAIRSDSVVREHYQDFELARTRLVVLRENRQQYVSYRIAGHIFWTKKRLLIPKGETLLTDGSHYARTRCGNRLSNTPRNETSPVEPALAALDSDPSRTEAINTAQPSEPARPSSQPEQTPQPRTDKYELTPVVPGVNAPALMYQGNEPAAPQAGLISSPYPWSNTPALTPAIPLRGGPALTIPADSLVPPPDDPAVVPEPGTLYLFGFTGIASLFALIWLGRPRRQ